MKKFIKALVVAVLGWQVRRLRKNNSFKVVAVVGSFGKTSTKLAIANVLSDSFKVQFQQGNYNDIVSVPLIFFGLQMPNLYNPLAWIRTFISIEKQLHKPYDYEIVVIELGTDGPGQIENFGKYIHPDFGIITAIGLEHMEYFSDLDAVTKEELAISKLVDKLIVNIDMVDPKTLPDGCLTYGLHRSSNYQLTDIVQSSAGYRFTMSCNGKNVFKTDFNSFGESRLYSVCAAITVAFELGVNPEKTRQSMNSIQQVSGRMNPLNGINNSLILDDTYNAGPAATKAALDVLYGLPATQKIAVLGNMNELGSYSQASHSEVGDYCDPKKVDLVLTIGKDANNYLAAAAEKRGCNVQRYEDPISAGIELKKLIKKDCVVLAKGSQNGVFAEETVKLLLANPNDADKLVRQSQEWLRIKHKQLGHS